MTIPLIQGTLRYAYVQDIQNDKREKAHAEGATFAAAVLPLIHACSADDAQVIFANMKVDSNTIGTVSFKVVKSAFERNYQCLGITCADVGGLLDVVNSNEYLPHAASCGSIITSTTQDEELLDGAFDENILLEVFGPDTKKACPNEFGNLTTCLAEQCLDFNESCVAAPEEHEGTSNIFYHNASATTVDMIDMGNISTSTIRKNNSMDIFQEECGRLESEFCDSFPIHLPNCSCVSRCASDLLSLMTCTVILSIGDTSIGGGNASNVTTIPMVNRSDNGFTGTNMCLVGLKCPMLNMTMNNIPSNLSENIVKESQIIMVNSSFLVTNSMGLTAEQLNADLYSETTAALRLAYSNFISSVTGEGVAILAYTEPMKRRLEVLYDPTSADIYKFLDDTTCTETTANATGPGITCLTVFGRYRLNVKKEDAETTYQTYVNNTQRAIDRGALNQALVEVAGESGQGFVVEGSSTLFDNNFVPFVATAVVMEDPSPSLAPTVTTELPVATNTNDSTTAPPDATNTTSSPTTLSPDAESLISTATSPTVSVVSDTSSAVSLGVAQNLSLLLFCILSKVLLQ